ncbi:MAG TPA: HD domain-containing phosphohydrolase [Planctomycetota bacterium]|jgi:putative two-component system response regulator|nr:HD domain-containing phosphohydrolase [Planctomycetota bacterium]
MSDLCFPFASSGRILVVDDDPADRMLLRRLLGAQGYDVREVADGESALAEVERNPPDLVVLDILLPGVDGYDICRRLKSDPRTRLIPVIMITGLDHFEARLRGVDLGVDDFLVKPYRFEELRARVRSLLSLKRFTDELEHAEAVLAGMARVVEIRDAYTGDHCRRVGEYSARVGEAFGLDEAARKRLRLGGLFHDLGKIAVPDAVLRKPGALDDRELAEMRRHPMVGADLCRPMKSLEGVIPLIRHHHERLDGSGYPDGLRGQEIPLEVRILTVCDIYDALRTERPYKPAFPRERSLRILRDEAARAWWDREVVETLARLTEGEPDGP